MNKFQEKEIEIRKIRRHIEKSKHQVFIKNYRQIDVRHLDAIEIRS